ncbi:uncharacterized protein TNCV_1797941 [Trichonephila clavipes]|nr:uncharacterized protein TNCV_1797941 [Trichonephila clavipes]
MGISNSKDEYKPSEADEKISNPVEVLDACKHIEPSRHGGTLNSRRTACPLVRLVEEKERWEAPDHPPGLLPHNWVETEQNHAVTSVMLKAMTNDRRTTLPLPR